MVRRPLARPVLGWVTVALGVGLLVALGSGTAVPQEDGDQVRGGAALYARYCAACHGPQGGGGTTWEDELGPGDEQEAEAGDGAEDQPGEAGREGAEREELDAGGDGGPVRGEGGTFDRGADVLAGPPLNDVDVRYVDLVIRTGRMPIIAREAGIIRDPELDDEDREAIVAWMRETFDLLGEVPQVPEGDPARGRILFNDHCAACHSTTGYGGVAGAGVTVLPVRELDRVAIVSAARIGPFGMPRFSERILTDTDLADIATALEEMDAERPSPLSITDVTHVSEAIYAGATIIVLIGLIGLISRMPRIAVQEEDYDWPEGDEPDERGDRRR